MNNKKILILSVKNSISEIKKEIKYYEKKSFRTTDRTVRNFYKKLIDCKNDALGLIQRFYHYVDKNKDINELRRIIERIKKVEKFAFPPEFLLNIVEEKKDFKDLENAIENERNAMNYYLKLYSETNEVNLKLFYEMMFKLKRQNFKLFYDIFLAFEEKNDENNEDN